MSEGGTSHLFGGETDGDPFGQISTPPPPEPTKESTAVKIDSDIGDYWETTVRVSKVHFELEIKCSNFSRIFLTSQRILKV